MQGDQLRIVQEIEVWPYKQMAYAQPNICPGEWDARTPLGFWDTNGSPNLGQTTRPCNNKTNSLTTIPQSSALTITPRGHPLHTCWDQPEYWEESRRPEGACYHSDSSERCKKVAIIIIIIIIIIIMTHTHTYTHFYGTLTYRWIT